MVYSELDSDNLIYHPFLLNWVDTQVLGISYITSCLVPVLFVYGLDTRYLMIQHGDDHKVKKSHEQTNQLFT